MTTVPHDKAYKQLPNCLREAFLGMNAPKTAITLDALFTLGFEEGKWYTYAQCLEATSNIVPVHIIREGLLHSSIRRRKLEQSRRGRPTFSYKMPTIDHLKYQIVLEWSRVSDRLQLADFSNVRAYKMALHRELINRGDNESGGNGVSFSRKWLCERLNVAPATLRAYEKLLGIFAEARWQMKQIKDRIDLIFLPEEKAHNGKYLEILTHRDIVAKVPATKAIAGMYLKQGYKVMLRSSITNRYYPSYPFADDKQIESNLNLLKNLFGQQRE